MSGFELLEVATIGEQLAVILPDHIVRALKADQNSTVVATWDRDGTLCLAPDGDEHDRIMAVARQVMRDDRAVLSALAEA